MKVRHIPKPVPATTRRQRYCRELSGYVMRDAVTGAVYAVDDPRWLYGDGWTPTSSKTFQIEFTQEPK